MKFFALILLVVFSFSLASDSGNPFLKIHKQTEKVNRKYSNKSDIKQIDYNDKNMYLIYMEYKKTKKDIINHGNN